MHCSPELIFKRAYGPQTDIWALGCVMCETLTGHTAFSRYLEKHVTWSFSDDLDIKILWIENNQIVFSIKMSIYSSSHYHHYRVAGDRHTHNANLYRKIRTAQYDR